MEACAVMAYLRVSGAGQAGETKDGLTRQRLAVEGYAERNGLTIVQVYQDAGVSGTKELDNRPALLSLLADVREGHVKTIVIERLDRLARDLMIQETMIRDFQKRGVDLISVAEPDLLSNDPTRKLMRQIMGAIAEWDKEMIVLKLRGSRERKKAATGRCEGQRPYGHYEGEMAIATRIRELRDAGMPYQHIAAVLNGDGIQPRSGVRWYASSVRKIALAQLERAA